MQDVRRGAVPIIWGLVALLVLAGTNVLTFCQHYIGELAFPWDFLGGYHSHAFAWYAAGSFLQPPEWFPWADMGFPAYWALQSGAFYLPHVALDLLEVPYTLRVATALQALHVLAGGVGMYALLRAIRIEPMVAILGALAYHYSSSFYSNAQHVDIVRTAALLPWVIWALLPQNLVKSWYKVFLASIILFQFLIAAYPGAIAAAAYSIPLFVFAGAFPYLRQQKGQSLILIYVLVGLSAASMAMLKWLPPIFEGDLRTDLAVDGGDWKLIPITLSLTSTLFLPFDRPFLPADPTMRSLWLPAALLVGLFFLPTVSRRSAQAFVLVIIAVFFGGLSPALVEGGIPLPGLTLSRFPIADWRPILHIGLIVLACAGWEAILRRQLSFGSVATRALIAIGVGAFICWAANRQGYVRLDLALPAATGFIAVALALLFAIRAPSDHLRPRVSVLLGVLLGATVIFHGMKFYNQEARVWRFALTPQVEEALFDGFRTEQLSTYRAPLGMPRRPERLVFGKDYAEMIDYRNSTAYNSCFYAARFCVLGYNNLRLSMPHWSFRRAVMDPQRGPALLNFVRQPQKLIVMPTGSSPDFSSGLGLGTNGNVETSIPGVTVEVLGYRGEWTKYRITTPQEVQVTENEIWTSGWAMYLCQEGQCAPAAEPGRTKEYLRTWVVPAGTWDVVLQFRLRSRRYTWPLFSLGLALAFLAGWLLHCSGKMRRHAMLAV